jgi:hypothetical protein
MSHTTPSLLGLPRELRDEIYSYLHHETYVQWQWTPLEMTDLKFLGKQRLELHNAPQLSVLLAHSQLRDEYMESACFKNLSTSIRLRAHSNIRLPKPLPWPAHLKDPNCVKMAPHALAHLRRFEVFVDCDQYCCDKITPGVQLWAEIHDLVKTTQKMSPHLHTVRIACYNDSGRKLKQPNEIYALFTSDAFLPPPLPSLSDFQLVQRAEGYRLKCGGESMEQEWLHAVVHVGAYVYVPDSANVRFWTRDEVVCWLRYLPYGGYRTCPEVTADIRSLGERMMGWREKRGGEDAKAWF